MEDCNKLLTRLTEPGPWNLWDKVLSRRVSSRRLDTHFGKKYNETSRTQDSSTATTAFSTPLNLFNVTPELTQAAISQKPDKESLTPPPPLNPAFLTPPPTVKTPSQQGAKRKRRRIQFPNYLDDHKSHGKQLKKRRHKKFKPYKYSMGEDED